MKHHFKEYSFRDWVNLPEEIKGAVQNNYWSPFEPKIGEKTRNEILKAFKQTLNCDYYLCEFGYFSHYLIGIRYLPKDSRTRIPKSFHGILINKGRVIGMQDSKNMAVKWSHSGTEQIKIE